MAIPFGHRILFRDRRQVEGEGVWEAGIRRIPFPAGSLARCGCRWDDASDDVAVRPGCRIHDTRRPRTDCPTCDGRRWLPVGVGWDGWFLRGRCYNCNALPQQEELHDFIRRWKPCTDAMKLIRQWEARGYKPPLAQQRCG